MKTIETMLKKEMKELQKIIESAEKRLKNTPRGYLRILKKKNTVEYYLKDDVTGGNGRYLKKNEKDIAKAIAQRDYDVILLKNTRERLKSIELFLDKYKKTSLRDMYQRINPCRRELIDAVEISDEEFVKQWKSVIYEGKEFVDDEQVIITEKGERVRSKSEKIIADKLYSMGIPYRYEYPLLLSGDVKIYPDFTILRLLMREEVYLEHFGMMDNIDYVNTAIYKINTYEKNGIYLGMKLFITHETSKRPLNTKILNEMLRELFCEE